MAAGVEGDQIRDANVPCRDHGYQWHRVVDALAMHEVPSALSDHSRDSRGEVIILSARPGRDTQNWDTLNDLFPGQSPGPVSCEYGDFETPPRGKSTCYLMDMRLDPADFRKEARANHEYTRWSLQHPFLSISGRFTGGFITYHNLSGVSSGIVSEKFHYFADPLARKQLRGAPRLPMR